MAHPILSASMTMMARDSRMASMSVMVQAVMYVLRMALEKGEVMAAWKGEYARHTCCGLRNSFLQGS